MNAAGWLKKTSLRLAKNFNKLDRYTLARLYLRGEGLEIGALHNPLPLPRQARAKYLDRLSESELRLHYPELAGKKLVPVDIVDDGEHMARVPEQSQDFVVACHFIEHCQDPIRALGNMLRVLKRSGILFLVIPDKRHTADSGRPETTWSHLTKDYALGPEVSRKSHYEECVRIRYRSDEAKTRKLAEIYEAQNYSIHFHCWSQTGMIEMVLMMKRHLGFEVEVFFQNLDEGIFIIRKASGVTTPAPIPIPARSEAGEKLTEAIYAFVGKDESKN